MANAVTTPDSYVPGVCNINRTEIARRRKAGYIGLFSFAVVVAILLGLSIERWWRVILFIPGFIAAIGFLQAKNKFCVSYAGSGLQNASEESDKATKIADATAHAKDKRRAQTMNLQAAGIAIVATALAVVI